MQVYSNSPFRWRRLGGYEVSSEGDKRFTAKYAIMHDGRSLQEWYVNDIKQFDVRTYGLYGPAVRKPKTYNPDLFEEYLDLWRVWAFYNKPLMRELYKLSRDHQTPFVLSNRFAHTSINNARALSIVLNELVSKGRTT